MIRSVRVALVAAASFALLAAGEVPQMVEAQVDAATNEAPSAPASVQLASLTPPALTLEAQLDEDETLVAPETSAKPPVDSLRELVAKITALPSIDLDDEMRCLAVAVYYESKGEPLDGQLAVAQVILNRVASGRFADSICGVVYQRGQFSFTWDGRPDRPRESAAWRTAQAIAVVAATDNWREIVPDATHFHATRVSPGWHRLRRVASVGNHVFYAFR
jgi:N-acetylmuramoyl-L-alanine amidase